MKVIRNQEPDFLRFKSYPAEREQIGALMKAVEALMQNQPVPQDALEVIAEVQAVKQRFPKRNPTP